MSSLVPARKVRIARIVAIAADVLQLAFFPAFVAGWLSPLTLIVDIVAALVLVWLLGWHLAFLPSFIAEVIPGLDLIPTWTAAVWIATRGRKSAGDPPRPADPVAPNESDPPREPDHPPCSTPSGAQRLADLREAFPRQRVVGVDLKHLLEQGARLVQPSGLGHRAGQIDPRREARGIE